MPQPDPTPITTVRTRVLTGIAPDAIPFAELMERQEPAILKGVAAGWPMVAAGRESALAAMAYLRRFDGGRAVVGYTGAAEIGGRYFYDESATRLNFTGERVGLGAYLDRIAATLTQEDGPSLYIGSTDLDAYLPGFRGENDLVPGDPMFRDPPPLASIWIGNRTIASAHYDMAHNIACCLVGRRRFTLFPPEQVHNLYPGPLEPTPGGQVVSMVDFARPDPVLHPRFPRAVATAQVADLEPGDMLFYPALWWHRVEALEAFNVMVNYWWNGAPDHLDSPMTTLLHAMLSLRDRPDPEKAAWRALFDHYVFGPADSAAAHLPPAARGVLGPIDAAKARRLRAQILSRLNR